MDQSYYRNVKLEATKQRNVKDEVTESEIQKIVDSS